MNSTGILHDINEFVPYVGMTGKYELRAPYTSLIDDTLEYTCISIINLSGYISQGHDPLNEIYLRNNDTENNFKLDLEKNRCLVTLQSGKGNKLIIPNSVISTLPNGDGVSYTSHMLGIRLGILPDYLDLTNIKSEISDIVYKHLGVNSEVFSTILGGSIVLTHDKHRLIDAARKVIVREAPTVELENIKLIADNKALSDKVKMLEKFIEDNISSLDI